MDCNFTLFALHTEVPADPRAALRVAADQQSADSQHDRLLTLCIFTSPVLHGFILTCCFFHEHISLTGSG